MKPDIDYLDRQSSARSARWRMKLTALAMLACAVMLGDLVAQAQPMDNGARAAVSCPDGFDLPPARRSDRLFTLAGDNHASVFNFTDRTLCSPAD